MINQTAKANQRSDADHRDLDIPRSEIGGHRRVSGASRSLRFDSPEFFKKNLRKDGASGRYIVIGPAWCWTEL
jgi:hypothetical protein